MHPILLVFSFLHSILGFALISSSLIKFKEPKGKRIFIAFLVMLVEILIMTSMITYIDPNIVSKLAVVFIMVVGITWYAITANDDFYVSVFSYITVVNVYIFISYTSDSLAILLFNQVYSYHKIIIRTLIYIALIPLLFKYTKPRFKILNDNLSKEWQAATLVPVLFLLSQVIILYYPQPYWTWSKNNWNHLIIIVVYMLLMAVYYVIYNQARGIVEKYDLEQKQLLMSLQDKLWQAELNRQKAGIAHADQLSHDVRHHNLVIYGLVTNNKIEELKAYLTNIEAKITSQKTINYTSHLIVNSILNDYTLRAQDNNIEINFDIQMKRNLSIDNVDLTSIFSNILENALEACLRLSNDSKRQISVTVKNFDKRLSIQVKNTSPSDIVFENDIPQTRKASGGIGIKSIIYTAELYDGTVNFMYKDNFFTSQIVLNEK